MDKLADKEITERIIGCAFAVHSKLGTGFLEKVYENAMVLELGKNGLAVQQQIPITVRYDGLPVGEYFADLVVENRIICELKANLAIAPEHEVQLVNYLARCAPGRAKRGRVVRGSRASRGVEPLWAGAVCRTAGRPRPAEGEAAGRIRAVPEGRERDWEVLSRHTEGRRTRATGFDIGLLINFGKSVKVRRKYRGYPDV